MIIIFLSVKESQKVCFLDHQYLYIIIARKSLHTNDWWQYRTRMTKTAPRVPEVGEPDTLSKENPRNPDVPWATYNLQMTVSEISVCVATPACFCQDDRWSYLSPQSSVYGGWKSFCDLRRLSRLRHLARSRAWRTLPVPPPSVSFANIACPQKFTDYDEKP